MVETMKDNEEGEVSHLCHGARSIDAFEYLAENGSFDTNR